jgi:hypothetical protein
MRKKNYDAMNVMLYEYVLFTHLSCLHKHEVLYNRSNGSIMVEIIAGA